MAGITALRLAQMSEDERPREKLFEHGSESLSVAELLAIVLRTGRRGEDALEFAASLLDTWGGLEGLYRARPAELMQEKGLKESKVATLAAVFELGRRIALLDGSRRETWKMRIERIARDTRFTDREMIYALFLNGRDKVLDEEILSYGGQNGAYMDIPVFYRKAVRLNAGSVVLVHNHPDGGLCASREDVALTNNVRRGLNTLGIKLKGHYITANGALAQVQ